MALRGMVYNQKLLPERRIDKSKMVHSSSVGPMANATDVLQPIGLLYSPYSPHLFGRSNVRRQVPPRPRRHERS